MQATTDLLSVTNSRFDIDGSGLFRIDKRVFQLPAKNPDQEGPEVDQLDEADDAGSEDEAKPASNLGWNKKPEKILSLQNE